MKSAWPESPAVSSLTGLPAKLVAHRGGCTESVCKLWPSPSLIQWRRYLNCSVSLSADLKCYSNCELVCIDGSWFPPVPFQVCHAVPRSNLIIFNNSHRLCHMLLYSLRSRLLATGSHCMCTIVTSFHISICDPIDALACT